MTTRRQFISATAAAGAAAAGLPLLSSCKSGGSGGGGTTELQMSWWGGESRHTTLQDVIEMYHDTHTDVSISPWFTSYSSYWQKMDTLAASKSMPDILLMGQFLLAYGEQGLLNDLTPFKDKIDVSDFPDLLMQQVTRDGKLLGIPLASNMPAVTYNETALQDAGVEAPDAEITWDGFTKYLADLAPKLPSGTYPCDDNSANMLPAFDVWVRQYGGGMWTTDAKLAVTVDMVQEWFAFWENLRKNKLCPPGTVVVEAAQVGTANASPFVTGKTFFTFGWDSGISSTQELMKDAALNLMRYPQGGGGSQNAVGDWLKCSASWCQSAFTEHGEAAADFLNFYVHDDGAVKAMAADFGIPASAAAADLVAQDAPEHVQRLVAYEKATVPVARSRDIADPPQVSDVTAALLRAAQSVMLEKASVSDAAKQFIDEANKALD